MTSSHAASERHILRLTEEIDAGACEVFKVLTDVQQHYQQFALAAARSEVLTPECAFGPGFQWRCSTQKGALFLRDACTLTVTELDAQALRYGVRLDDGLNLIRYSFSVQPLGPGRCRVAAAVDCGSRVLAAGGAAEACQPSERLACMLAHADGLLVQRLKRRVESFAAAAPAADAPLAGAVPCC